MRPPQPKARIEGAAAMTAGLDRLPWPLGWGGGLRLGVGRGWLGPVFGISAFAPSDTALEGVRMRQWRLPVDVGLRATVVAGRVSWYGEVGALAAIVGARALDLWAAKSGMALELGGRVSLGARLGANARLAPFVALSMDLIPDPPSVVALPMGSLGRTSSAWLTACFGLSWGMR